MRASTCRKLNKRLAFEVRLKEHDLNDRLDRCERLNLRRGCHSAHNAKNTTRLNNRTYLHTVLTEFTSNYNIAHYFGLPLRLLTRHQLAPATRVPPILFQILSLPHHHHRHHHSIATKPCQPRHPQTRPHQPTSFDTTTTPSTRCTSSQTTPSSPRATAPAQSQYGV